MRTPQTAGAVCWDLRLAAHFAALVRYVLAMPSHDDASKSFLQSCTEALQNELTDNGITITSPMPGPTARNQGRNQSDDDPDMIAKQGFEALMKGKNTIVAGGMATKAQGAAAKVLPDCGKADMHRSMADPGSADAYRRDRLVRRRTGVSTQAAHSRFRCEVPGKAAAPHG